MKSVLAILRRLWHADDLETAALITMFVIVTCVVMWIIKLA